MICGRSSKALKELFRSYLTCHLYLGCLSQAGVAKQLLKFLLKFHFHEAWQKIADSGSPCGQALQSVRAVPGLQQYRGLIFSAFESIPRGVVPCPFSPAALSLLLQHSLQAGGPVNGVGEVCHSSICLWVSGNSGCKDTESQ